nr:MFS transporter [Nonomuraea sp. FMUSA5-5]
MLLVRTGARSGRRVSGVADRAQPRQGGLGEGGDDLPALDRRPDGGGGPGEPAPLRQAVRRCGRQIATLFGYSITNAVGYYLMSSYMIAYMSEELGYSKSESQLTNVVSMLAYSVACVFAAMASDRFGRRPMLIAACAGFVLLPLPAFWLMGSGLAGAMLGTSLLAMLVSVIGTSNVPALVEMFPAKVRASGSAIGYTAAYVLFGGTAPFVATGLVSASGSAIAPAFYMVVIAAVSLVVVLTSFKETRGLRLDRGVDAVVPAARG